jgi:pimeloyl-ACP methyl ester carboxylesterase
VIVVPGLGTPKEGGLTLLYMLARAGLCAVAVDARLHGERPDAPDRERILDSNFTQGMHHIIYDTAADIKLLMDHWGDWQEGIGMIGVSAGGFVGHVVATSDKRLKAAAIAIRRKGASR